MPSRLSFMPLAVILAAGQAQVQAEAQAFEWNFSAEAGAELRVFPQEAQFSDQQDSTLSPSIWIRPELDYEWGGGDNRLTFIPFARWDADDDSRTHADIREASWLHIGEDWDILVGLGRVFWGVAESRHLVDIVNQTDLVEDVDEEDKLGQPMINLTFQTDLGTFGLFVLPGFRERTFADGDARLRGVLSVDGDNPSFDSGSGERHVDFAVRWSDAIGDFDVGLAAFRGTGREPRFLLGLDDANRPVLRPRYDLIDQQSLDVQYTSGAWLWKLEALSRGGQGDRFQAAVGGLEYTLFGAFDSPLDVGLLGEVLFDDRDENIAVAPPTFADNDLFVGTRLTFNDVQSTQMLAGAIVDLDTGAAAINLEAERRLGAHWKAELLGRFFADIPDDDSRLTGIRDDDHISIRLIRYF